MSPDPYTSPFARPHRPGPMTRAVWRGPRTGAVLALPSAIACNPETMMPGKNLRESTLAPAQAIYDQILLAIVADTCGRHDTLGGGVRDGEQHGPVRDREARHARLPTEFRQGRIRLG